MPLVCQLKNKSSFDASRGILKDSKGKMTLKFEQLGLGNWVNQVQFTAWSKTGLELDSLSQFSNPQTEIQIRSVFQGHLVFCKNHLPISHQIQF